MASFQKYSTKKGQMWLFKTDTGINPETGKRQTTTRRGFKTKKEAQISAAKLEQEIANGISIKNDNLTFQDVYDQWFSNHSKTIKQSTKKYKDSSKSSFQICLKNGYYTKKSIRACKYT